MQLLTGAGTRGRTFSLETDTGSKMHWWWWDAVSQAVSRAECTLSFRVQGPSIGHILWEYKTRAARTVLTAGKCFSTATGNCRNCIGEKKQTKNSNVGGYLRVSVRLPTAINSSYPPIYQQLPHISPWLLRGASCPYCQLTNAGRKPTKEFLKNTLSSNHLNPKTDQTA